MLSFKLSDEFVAQYEDRRPKWGFTDAGGNSLGELTFIAKYSRLKADGTKERWFEVCRRVIEGMFSIQKDYIKGIKAPWNERKAQSSAQEAFDRMFAFKWTPPGRGLWVMGTPIVNELHNSAALQNCAFISTADMTRYDPAYPFAFLMEASMLGIGVGFDVKGADKEFKIYEPVGEVGYVIPDTREGWVEAMKMTIESYLLPNKPLVHMDYSQIRPAGAPIATFGGTAAGPAPLARLIDLLHAKFEGRAGQIVTREDIADIGNQIGVCVVSGNVRRSAELLMGPIDDKDFIQFKNFGVLNPDTWQYDEKGPFNHRAEWGWMSNNSVEAKVEDDLSHIVEAIQHNGEPGVLWMDTTRAYGRLIDPPNHKDHRVAGYNPCLTDDAWVLTTEGPKQVRDLISRDFDAVVNGKPYASVSNGFFLTGTDREVFDLVTADGWTVRLTGNHQILTQNRGWVEAQNLVESDLVVVHDHHNNTWSGRGTEAEGYLLGHLWGDGLLKTDTAVLSLWGDQANQSQRSRIESLFAGMKHRSDWQGFTEVSDRGEWRLRSKALHTLAHAFGMDSKKLTDVTEQTSSSFYRGFLQAVFDTDGHVEGFSTQGGVSIRLTQTDYQQLVRIQRMLGRMGIMSSIRELREEGLRSMPDGKGGSTDYLCVKSWRLLITGAQAQRFMDIVGFGDEAKAAKWVERTAGMKRGFYTKPFVTKFVELIPAGTANVYDVTIEDVHAFDANGIYVHNCAEQSLESGECCTLVETYLNRHDSLEDFKRTLKFAYLYAKTVTLMATHWEKTNAIMQRNRRIGTSISGQANFIDAHGLPELVQWMDQGYAEVQKYDKLYSEWLCVRESIKTTTVKPSGTVSLLAGESPGCHWAPGGEYYLRTQRFQKDNPIVVLCRAAGYRIEPEVNDPDNTVVIYFPIHSQARRSEAEVSLFEKANLAVQAQRWWSDNSVSVTLTFNRETEAQHIGTVLNMFRGQLKSVSFLELDTKAYPQLPYTPSDADEYDDYENSLFMIDFTPLYEGKNLTDAEGEAYCTTDACLVEV